MTTWTSVSHGKDSMNQLVSYLDSEPVVALSDISSLEGRNI